MDTKAVDQILKKYTHEHSSIIAILQDLQELENCLPEEDLEYIAKKLSVPLSEIYRIATVYNAFSLTPRGKYLINGCSGGMKVMDEKTCMVDMARYLTHFLKDESCGKCSICRDGTRRMSEILDAVTQGEGKVGDIELLEELSWVVSEASLCAFGQTGAIPVLSALRHFKDEYEVHVKDKRCPAGVCKALITYGIDKDTCTACGQCREACPNEAITGQKKVPHTIDPERCVRCGACMSACKFDAIEVV